MTLSTQQRETLHGAIKRYNYPKVTYDFGRRHEVSHRDMRRLEGSVGSQLRSDDLGEVQRGLANVVYWGFRSMNFYETRKKEFLKNITLRQTEDFMRLVRNPARLDLLAVKRLGSPQFSNIALVSKLLMFLDRRQFVVLDRHLADQEVAPFDHLRKYPTYVPITRNNHDIYTTWCVMCRQVAGKEFHGNEILPVDVERGIFQLVRDGSKNRAADLVVAMHRNYGV